MNRPGLIQFMFSYDDRLDKASTVPCPAYSQKSSEDTLENVGFDKFAPYLKDPLVLVGFVLLLCFGTARSLIKSRLLTPVSGIKSYRLLQMILCGFVLSVVVIGLGFGLKYREASEAEQRDAVGLMRRELDANLASVEALRRNTVTMLEIVQRMATSLGSPEVKVMAVLSPEQNLQSGTTTPPKQLALVALSQLLESKLDRNKVKMARGDAVAMIIRGTIDRTRPTIASLSDPSREPHPGFSIILDTPLLTYREPLTSKYGELSQDEAALKATSPSEHVYRHLASLKDQVQIIVIENSDPPVAIAALAHIEVFTGQPSNGRFGLLARHTCLRRPWPGFA